MRQRGEKCPVTGNLSPRPGRRCNSAGIFCCLTASSEIASCTGFSAPAGARCFAVVCSAFGGRGRSSVDQSAGAIRRSEVRFLPASPIATSSVDRAPDYESGCRGFDPRVASAFASRLRTSGKPAASPADPSARRGLGQSAWRVRQASQRSAHLRIPPWRPGADAGAAARSILPGGRARTRTGQAPRRTGSSEGPRLRRGEEAGDLSVCRIGNEHDGSDAGF